MAKILEIGSRIKLQNGNTIEVIEQLGRGGQGIVYKVRMDNKDYALKWYIHNFKDKELFKENIQKNIHDKAPNNNFLWPIALTEDINDTFGYVMDLRPKDYVDFSDILNCKVKFKSTEAVIDTAINITQSFRDLHRKGKTYQDLNDGNFFVNIKNGDVLICDNDNITPYGQNNPGNIIGKPGYMAPEIVTGKERPGQLTDYHSLAVILFKLFCHHDPLMGRKHVEAICITEEKERELYGTNPVFIFDPDDDSNRPVLGIHPNPIKMWPKFPKYLRDAFEISFCKGMKEPNSRLPDNEWIKKLVKFKSDIIHCPNCSSVDMMIPDKNDGEIRFPCGHNFSYPLFLKLNNYTLPLFPKTKIYECHTKKDCQNFSKITGEVVMNKSNPNLWGIKNHSGEKWSFIIEGEKDEREVKPNDVLPITTGLKIHFDQIDAEIIR